MPLTASATISRPYATRTEDHRPETRIEKTQGCLKIGLCFSRAGRLPVNQEITAKVDVSLVSSSPKPPNTEDVAHVYLNIHDCSVFADTCITELDECRHVLGEDNSIVLKFKNLACDRAQRATFKFKFKPKATCPFPPEEYVKAKYLMGAIYCQKSDSEPICGEIL